MATSWGCFRIHVPTPAPALSVVATPSIGEEGEPDGLFEAGQIEPRDADGDREGGIA
jgi:hypothetical protein